MIGSTQDPLAARALGAAIGLVMWPVTLFGLASLYLLIGGRLDVNSAWLMLILSAVAALMLARRTGGDWTGALIVVAVVLAATIASHFLVDTSWDGQRYHYDATRALADGWNPYRETFQTPAPVRAFVRSQLWPQYYPYAAWLTSAVQIAAGVDIESAKSTALVLAVALLLAAFGASATWGLHRWQALALAVLVAGNPIIVVQAFTRMNDGLLASCLGLCAIFTALWLRDRRPTFVVAAIGAMAFGLNLKFSSAPTFAILCILIIALAWQALGRAQALRAGAILAASGALGICMLGAHPYVSNTLEHHHPFYPVFGADAVDIITINRPSAFSNISEVERLAHSYFGPTSNAAHTGGHRFKFPFTIENGEFDAAGAFDARLAGFGPLFSAAFLFALALGLWIVLRDRTRPRLIALCAVGGLAVASLSMPEAWWARYVPQLWWTPVLVALVALVSAQPRVRFAGWALVSILSANVAFVAAASAWRVGHNAYEVRHQIEQIAALHQQICIQTSESNARLELLRNAGVDMQLDQRTPPAWQQSFPFYAAGIRNDPSYALCRGSPPSAGFALTLGAPSQFSVPEGSPIRISTVNGGLRLQGHVANASPQLKTDGASVALGSVNERAFAGRLVRVTFRARGLDGATDFTAAYSTHGNGNSGWQTLRVTNELSDVSFDYHVPTGVFAGNDFVGIMPPGAGAIEIQSIRVEVPNH